MVIDYKIMVINYSFINQFWKEWWLLVIDYCLLVIDYQREKLFGKRFFFEKFFWTKLCYSIFWKTLLILILIESSLDSLLESWILIERLFDSWNLFDAWFLTWVFGIIKINLESFASTKRCSSSRILQQSWHHSLGQPLLQPIWTHNQ